ncbi:Amidases [Phaffia rhodozyma]|uniref:Amidases n=1 Tax=Phaffia rhodozyma TaxID=264483 RepID=A0A0F7SLG7_PHARH|nr:Amidases [Phaffia rhodozyma]
MCCLKQPRAKEAELSTVAFATPFVFDSDLKPVDLSLSSDNFPIYLLEIDIYGLNQALSNGSITSFSLVNSYMSSISQNNHQGLLLRALIETAPINSVLSIAQKLDDERANGTVRSSLHGIPIILKDNIATDIELGMNTTAGSYALLGSPVPRDSHVSMKLRAAGAIILGKANLSEFANFKGNITNGWSARGGQTQSAYVVGGFAAGGDPCGSSSGSAVGVSAGWAASSLGSETDGSIVCPSNRAALFGIKPSVGLVSRAGVVPISSTQDTTGPIAKSTYDAALLLETIAGFDERDNATYAAINYTLTNYTQYAFAPYNNFSAYRIGVPRKVFFNETLSGNPPEINEVLEAALLKMTDLGAFIQDPADLPSADELTTSRNETIVLQTDFKVDLGTYLMGLNGTGPKTLEDVINFNDANADLEFAPGECCQVTLIASVQTTGKSNPAYIAALASDQEIGGTRGIDAVLDEYGLDALVLPTEGYASSPAAIVGYPIGTVPLGYLNSTGQPFGMAIIVKKWNEPTLIGIMAAFEAAFAKRRVPEQLQ